MKDKYIIAKILAYSVNNSIGTAYTLAAKDLDMQRNHLVSIYIEYANKKYIKKFLEKK